MMQQKVNHVSARLKVGGESIFVKKKKKKKSDPLLGTHLREHGTVA